MVNKSHYDKISKVLKILAKIVSIILISYGCIVGIFGLGPDGPTVLIGWRLIGLFVLLQGILYILSNSKFRDDPRLLTFYFSATFLPAIVIVIVAFFSINAEGMESFVKAGGLITVAVLLLISMFAPLSMIFSILGAKRNREKETGL
jgi:uncharacterized membrane protein HdeD (DUF308 family)